MLEGQRMVLHWHISPYKVKLGSTACSLRLRSITTTTVASTVQGQANLKVKMPRIILRKFPSVCRLSTWAFKTSHYAIFCNFHCHGKKLRSHPFRAKETQMKLLGSNFRKNLSWSMSFANKALLECNTV